MSLEEKIAGEFNHFLKIMNHKEEGKPDESLSEDEKRHSISPVSYTHLRAHETV